jgi:hypothetical protein
LFKPYNSITRAEAALMMARAKGLDKDNDFDVNKFDDVNENTHAEDAIHATREAGIFEGDKHNNFHPDDAITRGEIAAILVRAF